MKDADCVLFLQWLLPKLQMRWPGFRKVRRQVCKRIGRRLAELDLPDVVAYQEWIIAHPEELEILDGYCRVTISRFYRDRGVFNRLRDEILPELAAAAQANGQNVVRCWNAGCASGEEPYTINILWKRAVCQRVPGVALKIIATDSDPRMLERASQGCYPRSSLKDFPNDWLASCFAAVNGEYSVEPEYRLGIEWCRQDIRAEAPPGEFDFILCRHLAFTYFDEALQLKTLIKILARLRPGGILVTGKQEPLPTTTPSLIECQPRMGLYRKLEC
jgi:chemotaxis protein methyltransferase CheR